MAHFNGTSELDSIFLNSIEVESVLKSLTSGKASGPNGLNNRILKELSKELAQPLCNFFNFSLDKGVLPSSYKEANVCPIHKKDKRSLVNNYRPISLLNAEVKVFERLILKKHVKPFAGKQFSYLSTVWFHARRLYCESTYLLVQYILSGS